MNVLLCINLKTVNSPDQFYHLSSHRTIQRFIRPGTKARSVACPIRMAGDLAQYKYVHVPSTGNLPLGDWSKISVARLTDRSDIN